MPSVMCGRVIRFWRSSQFQDPGHTQLGHGTQTGLFAHPKRPCSALLASPHPRGLVRTPLGTGHAGALAPVALDHAHPRGCAMAVGVLWAGWGTTAAP